MEADCELEDDEKNGEDHAAKDCEKEEQLTEEEKMVKQRMDEMGLKGSFAHHICV